MTETAGAEPAQEPVSDLMFRLLDETPEEKITIGKLLEGFGPRGFGLALLAFTIPAAAPPPIGSLFGFPVMLFAGQMILRWRKPWLPARVTSREMSKAALRRVFERARPWVRRVEKLAKPRMRALTTPTAEQAIGAVVMWLALLIALPGPLTNVPPGIAIAILSLGLIQRDGLMVLVGLVSSVVASILALSGLILTLVLIWEGVKYFFA